MFLGKRINGRKSMRAVAIGEDFKEVSGKPGSMSLRCTQREMRGRKRGVDV